MTWFLSAVWGLLTAIFFLFILKNLSFLFSSHKIWTLDRVSISSGGLLTAIFDFIHFKKHIFCSFLFTLYKIWTLDRVSISSGGLLTGAAIIGAAEP